MFIAREDEIKALKEALNSDRKCTILLYGRRRIGKTALVNEVLKDMDDPRIETALEEMLEEYVW